MGKFKTKTIYVNEDLEKRINAKEKESAKAFAEKKKSDPIEAAYRESNKSPKSMFRESMKHFTKLQQI